MSLEPVKYSRAAPNSRPGRSGDRPEAPGGEDAGLGLALAKDALDRGIDERQKNVGNGLTGGGIGEGTDEIDIADGFAAAAEAAGDFGELDGGEFFEGVQKGLADLQGVDDAHAAGGFGAGAWIPSLMASIFLSPMPLRPSSIPAWGSALMSS